MTNTIGVMLNNLERDRLKAFAVAANLGFEVVHTNAIPESFLTGEPRERYIEAARTSGVKVASMFVGFDGQSYADIPSIRRTVGLVIPELQLHRTEVAKSYSHLARELGVPSLSGHLGFMPGESSEEYGRLVSCFRELLNVCAANGQAFHLETGQESAEGLVRFIEAVDRPNLYVNFDPGNFILYGTDDPSKAFERLAPWVRGVHCKDGIRPSAPDCLGEEVPFGQGEVDFPQLLRRLHEIGYAGPLVIEREAGPDPVRDILSAREDLQRLLEAC